jgi:hypothetical protein
MLNKNFVRFGGGGDTFLYPTTLVVLLVTGVLLLVVPRKYALAPFLLGSLLIPISQTLTLTGVHFMAYRVLLTVAWLRLFWRGPSIRGIRLNVLDKLVIAWGISATVTFSLLWFNVDAFVNRIGLFYDATGVYFLVRLLHRSEEDTTRTVKILAAACVVIACGMLTEHFARVNPFSLVGGQAPEVREGRVRAAGPFAHPIIAGTCAAGFLPLFLGLWWQGKSKTAAAAGAMGATVMAVTSTSSTAMLAYAAGVVALFMWPLRRSLRWMRWGVMIALVGLHLAMKAPVWALIARIDVVGGSSSYHRFELVNQTILHFWDWFLLGQRSTYQWGFNLWDTANTYVETAVTGGLSTLVLFVAIVVFAFKRLGSARKITKEYSMAKLFWALGAALFATAVGFVGITYYDQASVVWYSLVALISAATSMTLENDRKSVFASRTVAIPEDLRFAETWQSASIRTSRTAEASWKLPK